MQSQSKSFVIQSYIDVKTIADIIFHMETNGFCSQKSYSAIIRDVCDVYHRAFCKKPFDSIEQAIEYLNAAGYSLVQLESKDRPGLRVALKKESMAETMREFDETPNYIGTAASGELLEIVEEEQRKREEK